jgi:hypothetical protein
MKWMSGSTKRQCDRALHLLIRIRGPRFVARHGSNIASHSPHPHAHGVFDAMDLDRDGKVLPSLF